MLGQHAARFENSLVPLDAVSERFDEATARFDLCVDGLVSRLDSLFELTKRIGIVLVFKGDRVGFTAVSFVRDCFLSGRHHRLQSAWFAVDCNVRHPCFERTVDPNNPTFVNGDS